MGEVRSTNFPFFYWWACKGLNLGGDWTFGFYFAPCPGQEHLVGDIVRALVHFELRVGNGIKFLDWSFDPANRPIGHNQV